MPCLQHVLIPDIPRDGELFFEALMVVFVCTTLGLQYLNMYRTIWWLPHSYTLYAMVSIEAYTLYAMVSSEQAARRPIDQ